MPHINSKTWQRFLLILVLIFVLALFLAKIFSGQIILQPGLYFSGFGFKYYGLIMAASIASAFFIARKRARKAGIPDSEYESIVFITVLAGFLGARIYHVLTDYELYQGNFLGIFKIWEGGLSIFGALFGGLIALIAFYYLKPEIKKFGLLKLLDVAVPAVAVAQSIGRFGNFFNYEALGLPTSLPWKMFVPESRRPYEYIDSNYFHPFFLYESIANIIIAGLLLLYERKNPKKGSLFFTYVFLYNFTRFFLEFLRVDSPLAFGLKINILLPALLAFFGLIGLFLLYYGKTKPAS